MLGSLGAGPQLGACLLQRPGASLQRLAQLVPLAASAGLGLLQLGAVRGGLLGKALLCEALAVGGLGEARGDLLAFPLRVGAYPVQVASGVLAGPRRLGPGVLGMGLGCCRPLVSLLCLLPVPACLAPVTNSVGPPITVGTYSEAIAKRGRLSSRGSRTCSTCSGTGSGRYPCRTRFSSGATPSGLAAALVLASPSPLARPLS